MTVADTPSVAKNCGTCANGKERVNTNGHELGFMQCRFLPLWDWRNPAALCAFVPSKWVKR